MEEKDFNDVLMKQHKNSDSLYAMTGVEFDQLNFAIEQ